MNPSIHPPAASIKAGALFQVFALFAFSATGFAQGGPPVITQQPQSQTVNIGSSVTFTVAVSSVTFTTYQWKFNGVNIPGATSAGGLTSTYTIPNAQPSQAGTYSVGCTNAAGGVVSANASLTVNAPNLVPFQVPGWSDKIVVATTTNTSTDSNPLTTTNTLYVKWAIANSGTLATSVTFSNELDLDGVFFAIGYVNPPMPPSSFAAAPYQSLGMLSAGTHTLKLKVDSANQIVESNEGDNEYTKVITVVAPPSITNQPLSQTVAQGVGVAFSVGAAGSAPLHYQWQFNGTNISGATNMNYAIASAQPTNAGNYSVAVTNGGGWAISSNATLTVSAPLILSAGGFATNGFKITVTGPAWVSVVIEASTDLTVWAPIYTNNTGASGGFTFTDTTASSFGQRFYRGHE